MNPAQQPQGVLDERQRRKRRTRTEDPGSGREVCADWLQFGCQYLPQQGFQLCPFTGRIGQNQSETQWGVRICLKTLPDPVGSPAKFFAGTGKSNRCAQPSLRCSRCEGIDTHRSSGLPQCLEQRVLRRGEVLETDTVDEGRRSQSTAPHMLAENALQQRTRQQMLAAALMGKAPLPSRECLGVKTLGEARDSIDRFVRCDELERGAGQVREFAAGPGGKRSAFGRGSNYLCPQEFLLEAVEQHPVLCALEKECAPDRFRPLIPGEDRSGLPDPQTEFTLFAVVLLAHGTCSLRCGQNEGLLCVLGIQQSEQAGDVEGRRHSFPLYPELHRIFAFETGCHVEKAFDLFPFWD